MKIHPHGERQSERGEGGGNGDVVEEEKQASRKGNGRVRESLGQARGKAQGFRHQAHLDAELRGAGLQANIAADFVEAAQAARERAGSGLIQGRGESAQKSYGQKCELEAGVEELFGIEDQKAQRHSGEQIQSAAAAEEISANHKEREAG